MKVKRILSFLLAGIMSIGMIQTSAVTSNAVEKSKTVSNGFSSMTVEAIDEISNLHDNYSSKANGNVEKVLSVGLDMEYNQDDNFRKSSYPGKLIKVTVSNPGVLLIKSIAKSITKSIRFDLYTNSNLTTSVGYLNNHNRENSSSQDTIKLGNSGTYYLFVNSYNYYTSSYPSYFSNSISLNIEFYSTASTTLTANKWYNLGESNNNTYYKVTMPYSGYMTIYGDNDINFDLCDSNKLTKYGYLRIDDSYGYRTTLRLGKGTYYLYIKSPYVSNDHYKIKYTTTSTDQKLSNNKALTIYPASSSQVTYLKFTPTVNGYINVKTFSDNSNFDSSGYITLCNSKKSAISNAEWVWNSDVVFGVKKNTTYYIKLTDFSQMAKVKYVQKAVSEKSGSSKKKAVTIKKNKYISGIIAAGENKADWYKVKLTKNQVLKIYSKGNASGQFRVTIYNSKGKKLGDNQIISDDYGYTLKSWSKYKKGIYYLKVYRGNSKSSGQYKLKWN